MSDPITDALVEQAARAGFGLDCVDEAHANALWNACPESTGQYLRETRAALEAVVPDIIRQAKAKALREAEPTLQAMLEYGSAIRGDWSDFDGGGMKAVIEDWVQEIRTPDPSHTVEWHRMDLGLCMAGGGHWCGRWGHCDDHCGCEPCAAEREERDE